ncbi:MAG: hypothetical protein ACRES9_09970 [Gammaproteobacteria bacterium]
MSNENHPVSAAEDLAYIRRIMEDTRRTVALRGDGFIVWGLVVLLGLLGNYIFNRIAPPGWAWIALWGGLTVAGWSFTWWQVRRSTREARASMPGGRLLGAVWIAFSIAIIVILFVGIPLGAVNPAAVGGITTAMVGMGVFLTGVLMGTRWVRNLAFGWWAGAVAAFVWHGEAQLLIVAIVIMLFYIVPGFILNILARKQYTAAQA